MRRRNLVLMGLALLALASALAWALWPDASDRPAAVLPAPPQTPAPTAPTVPNPHASEAGAEACLSCHTSAAGPDLAAAPEALCRTCHPGIHGAGGHPVAVAVAPGLARDLPLGADRVTTCVTCHDPHAHGRALLRRGGSPRLCVACHPR